MIATLQVDVSLGNEETLVSPIDNQPIKAILGCEKRFSFELCKKSVQMADLKFQQFWMRHNSLYQRGKSVPANRAAILEFAWWYGMQNLAIFNRGYLDSIILAHISPYVRLHGARRVFRNTVPTKPGRVGMRRQDLLKALDNELASQRHREVTIVDFQRETTKFLGPERFGDTLWEKYEEFADQLLDEGRAALNKEEPPAWKDRSNAGSTGCQRSLATAAITQRSRFWTFSRTRPIRHFSAFTRSPGPHCSRSSPRGTTCARTSTTPRTSGPR